MIEQTAPRVHYISFDLPSSYQPKSVKTWPKTKYEIRGKVMENHRKKLLQNKRGRINIDRSILYNQKYA